MLQNVESGSFSNFFGLGKRAKENKAEKHEQKMAKKAAQTDLKKSKADLKRSKGEAKKMKAAAKQTLADSGGGNGGIIGTAMGALGNIFGKSPVSNVEGLSADDTTDTSTASSATSRSSQASGSSDTSGGEVNAGNPPTDPWYKQTWFFISAGATVLGGILLFAFWPKKA